MKKRSWQWNHILLMFSSLLLASLLRGCSSHIWHWKRKEEKEMMAVVMAIELFASASRLIHGFFFLFLFWEVAAFVAVVAGGDTGGFISIDCGITDGYNYTDEKTTLLYVSDTNYIDTGINHNISSSLINSDTTISTQERTLRSFPQGKRNCYTLPVQKDQKYLVRATFLHGNYDGGQSVISQVNPVIFDIYLGVNLWKSMKISNATSGYETDVITVAKADYISICIVNKGLGTPFISSLELRPLKVNLYPNATASVALVTYHRYDFGPMDDTIIRFPDDPYDRTWQGVFVVPYWDENSTISHVQSCANDMFEVPSAVLQTAASNPYLNQFLYYLVPPTGDDALSECYLYLHFAEVQSLGPNQSRVFDVYLDDRFYQGSFSPQYLVSSYVYTTDPSNFMYDLSLRPTASSTLQPIINAMEIYSVLRLTETATDAVDVDAIRAIKQQYKLSRNWEGDPCAPKDYLWDGLRCNHSVSDPPRITSVDLSSSGLIGIIGVSFAMLKAIKYLDLSYNNLTGQIPIFLAELPSLEVLNLTSNQLSGPIPSLLLVRSQNGSLTLRTEGNPYLCTDATPCMVTPTSKKKKIATPVIVIPCTVAAVLLLLVIVILWRLRKLQCCLRLTLLVGWKGWRRDISPRPHYEDRSMQEQEYHDNSLQFENRHFTYTDLKNITNNFERVLGEGAFGIVYHGYLDDGTQVAVKMRHQLSSQGIKEFLAEVQHLTRVHHRNLVSIVGYCKDRNSLAVVYRYMSQGSLREHLQGKVDNAGALSWRRRLLIAVDAARGLEYLHTMCQPPVIHRDVTTGNILLSEKLEAKLADFGLSKAFQSDRNSHVSMAVVGTPGYLDPEYHATYMLSEKSDVYSFGVVLLELITGRPPIVEGTENAHIVPWVLQGLSKGNIEDIVDSKLRGEYSVNSVWKCADVALKCTSQRAHQRPTMADVAVQLKESLELEAPFDGIEKAFAENKCTSHKSTHTASMSSVVGSGPIAR